MPKHADGDPVTVSYASSRNVTFHGEGEDVGYTWGEWRDMTQTERDEAINEFVFDSLIEVSVDDPED